MKRVCFFSGDITRSGGTERVSTTIMSGLAKLNEFSLCVVSLTEQNSDMFFPLDSSVARYKLFDRPVRGTKDLLAIISKLKNFIKEKSIDIIIDIDGILDLYSLAAKASTKVKVVSWEQFNYYETLGNKYRMFIKRLAARHADAIVVLTDEDKGYYSKNLRVRHLLHRIYNPIELDENSGEYDVNSKILLGAGRLTFQKGFDILLDSVVKVFSKHPDWSLEILGEGEDRPMLEQKIKTLGLENNVKLIGRVSNVADYYKKSSIFILSSRFEGFGLVITEAKSYHLPVVSFKCRCGPSELVMHGGNGYLIDCFDIDDMAEKINLLIENNEKRLLFSQNSLDDTFKFSMKKVISEWRDFLNNL